MNPISRIAPVTDAEAAQMVAPVRWPTVPSD